MDRSTAILIVEDSEEDYQAARRLLSRITNRLIERCPDAASAMAYLGQATGKAPESARFWPSIILLDLNMPAEDGRSLLLRLKADDRLRRIPVVILTTSASPQDLEYCYAHGAAGYIVKPVDLGNFRTSLEQMANYWLRAVTLPPSGLRS